MRKEGLHDHPLDRLNKEVERRTAVFGIVPNPRNTAAAGPVSPHPPSSELRSCVSEADRGPLGWGVSRRHLWLEGVPASPSAGKRSGTAVGWVVCLPRHPLGCIPMQPSSSGGFRCLSLGGIPVCLSLGGTPSPRRLGGTPLPGRWVASWWARLLGGLLVSAFAG
ncbi:hypothetical protein GCM10027203_29760 [Nonomuraea fastidiosa]